VLDVSIENDELRAMFMELDQDGSGAVSAKEFAEYLVKPDDVPTKNPTAVSKRDRFAPSARSPNWRMKLALQVACSKKIDAIGWQCLFNSFDDDGSGELDLSEFQCVLREHCRVSEEIVSGENIAALFKAVDTDENGTVDAHELQEFLGDRPFEKEMPYQLRNRHVSVNSNWR
jgi:Ca2+-binding EF-hand superfamily protein